MHALSPCTESGRRPCSATGPPPTAAAERKKAACDQSPSTVQAAARYACPPGTAQPRAVSRTETAELPEHLQRQVDVPLRFERRRQHDLRIALQQREREQQPRDELRADVARQAVFAALQLPADP